MQFRLVDVGTAIKNLEDVWVLMEAYAKNSKKRAAGVSTQLALKRFVDRFQRVISPGKTFLVFRTIYPGCSMKRCRTIEEKLLWKPRLIIYLTSR